MTEQQKRDNIDIDVMPTGVEHQQKGEKGLPREFITPEGASLRSGKPEADDT